MADFASSLYLGLRHPSTALPAWSALTTGAPAALESTPLAEEVAAAAARLQGCEAGVVATSTLHLFWDLMGILARCATALLVDRAIYPIAGWGTQRARAQGALVRTFASADIGDLCRQLAQVPGTLRPVVVTDAVSVKSGAPLPVGGYLEAVRRSGGLVVVDNTQALGVLGASPSRSRPYGVGGGGILRYCGAVGSEVLVVSSLAKAFGAPLAVLAGSRRAIAEFGAASETSHHCSPPSTVALLAAQRALACNAAGGDRLRDRLLQRARLFRRGLESAGMHAEGGLFPVQTLVLPTGHDAIRLHAWLLAQGIRTVLQRSSGGSSARLSVILRADHEAADVKRLCRAFAAWAMRRAPNGVAGYRSRFRPLQARAA